MKPNLLFCHGMGFDRFFWNNLAPYFSSYHSTYLDLGFFGEENLEIQNDDNKEFIGIGHSIGLAKLVSLAKEKNINFTKLIGLQSLTLYPPMDSFKKQYQDNFKQSLLTFYQYCFGIADIGNLSDKDMIYYINKIDTINKQKILDILDFMNNTPSIPTEIDTLILSSSQDMITPHTAIIDNFKNDKNVRIVTIDTPGHCLGMTHAKLVSEKIYEFIR